MSYDDLITIEDKATSPDITIEPKATSPTTTKVEKPYYEPTALLTEGGDELLHEDGRFIIAQGALA